MAEQQQTPTFKLVLVGDGGTGKVCRDNLAPDVPCVFIETAGSNVYPTWLGGDVAVHVASAPS